MAHKVRALVLPSVIVSTLLLGWGRLEAEHLRPFVSPRELRGITAIRLDVDGFPGGLGDPGITEATLLRAVTEHLKRRGVPAPDDPPISSPLLHITVLAPRHDAGYHLTILVRLEEPCSVARKPGLALTGCVTWSVQPRLGTVAVGQEATIQQLVLAAVEDFARAFAFDNRPETQE